MSIERNDEAVLELDARGVPLRPTNMSDVITDAGLPSELNYLPVPPGYSHGSPPHLYDTTTTEEIEK